MDVKKTKVESLDIIVTMMEDKPYYEIKYKEVGSDHFCIGYSSYRLDYVLEWKKQYFELVEREAGADQGWIPCSERLPEDGQTVLAYIGGRHNSCNYLCACHTVEEYTDRWRNARTGFAILCEVIAWMPLSEPYKGE